MSIIFLWFHVTEIILASNETYSVTLYKTYAPWTLQYVDYMIVQVETKSWICTDKWNLKERENKAWL